MNQSTYEQVLSEKHILGSIEYKFVISSVNIGKNGSPLFSLSVGSDKSPFQCRFVDSCMANDLEFLQELMAAAIDFERSFPGSMVEQVGKIFETIINIHFSSNGVKEIRGGFGHLVAVEIECDYYEEKRQSSQKCS